MIQTILLLLVGTLNVMVALAVLSRSVHRSMNLWFFALALASGAWVFGIAGFLAAEAPVAAINWAKFFYIAPLCIVAASVAFASVFPSGGRARAPRVYLVLAGLVVLSALIVLRTDFLFSDLIYHDWGKEIVLNKPFYLLYTVYLLIAFVLTLLPIYKKSKTEKGLYRSQATVFFHGYMLSCVLGVFFNLVLPWFGNYQLIWLGPLATTFYVTLTAYGIVRHRLFDVRIVAARAVGYLLSVSALAVLYGALAFTIITLLLGGQEASLQERGLTVALAVVVALTFGPIRRFFDRATNNLFYRDAYNTQEFLDKFNHALVSSIDLNKMAKNTTQVIQSTLKTDYCLLVIENRGPVKGRIIGNRQDRIDEESLAAIRSISRRLPDEKVIVVDQLEQHFKKTQMLLQTKNIALIGAILDNEKKTETLGYLVVSSKKSGYPHSKQDIAATEISVNEYVIAIQNVMRFEEIQSFNVTLQQSVDDATKKLRQSNEKLRILDQTKDDFISMASHQLRTPLTSIKGYISMVLEGDAGKINPVQQKMLQQAFTSSQRMTYLIADLLNMSRLKTGKFVIEAMPTNLATIVEQEVEQLVETAKSRDLTLTYNQPSEFPELMLDETKIRQVIMNFVDNAIYYTPAGGKIEIRLEETPKSVELRVIDNGIGVSKAEQHHLFTKFYRASNAKRARPDGTGLGLFMAKKVVVAQGGALIFDSQEGKGSTFGFSFPKKLIVAPEQQDIAKVE